MPIFAKHKGIYYKFPSEGVSEEGDYPWLRSKKDQKQNTGNLCSFCNRLDFEFLFRRRTREDDQLTGEKPQELEGIVLGNLDRLRQANCEFCHHLGAAVQYNNPGTKSESEHADAVFSISTTPEVWSWQGPWNPRHTDDLPVSVQLISHPIGLFLSPSVVPLEDGASVALTFFSGREVTQLIDKQVVLRWISDCEEMENKNTATITQQLNMQPSAHVRYIDIVEQCVIDGIAAQKFAALSYVWGGCGRDFNLTNENENELCRTDSPSPIQRFH
jgi:hypothetical protein